MTVGLRHVSSIFIRQSKMIKDVKYVVYFSGKKNFLMIADLLNVEVLETDQVLLERLMPNIYRSTASNKLKQIVRHR
jgi:hypothetical protein